MRPFTTGSDYVNQIGLETDEGSERIKAAYGVNYERLAAVKGLVARIGRCRREVDGIGGRPRS